jgi:uncharacterized protein (DUF2147 family)
MRAFRIKSSVVLSAIVLAPVAIAPALAADPLGEWLTGDRTGKVRVVNCGGALCGTLVWLQYPTDPQTNQPKTDRNNADARLRGRPLIGVPVVLGMRPVGSDKWEGEVYNAEDGNIYPGAFIMYGPNTAVLKGCGMLACKQQTWTRTAGAPNEIPSVGLTAEISSGSGVVIGTGGEILTNSHVVEECQSITVRLSSGKSEGGTVVANDQRNDLAVVRLPTAPSSVAVFREEPLRAGDAIVALGYPLSGLLATGANLSVGNVSALAGLRDDSRYLQISAPVQPGNSGGPLLDASGHLAGIVTAKLDAVRIARFTGDIPQNVNFALKAEVARTFLDSKGIAYQTARSDKELSPADVNDVAQPFTVRIDCKRIDTRTVAPTKPNPPTRSKVSATSHPSPCGSFQKLQDGRWSVTKQIRIEKGNASTVLNPGSILGPGARVAGVAIYEELEKSCL